jgi:hypothetical protein
MTSKPPRADDFRTALLDALAEAERRGFRAVEINAGDLHTQLGGYPSLDHRMATCSNVMRAAMKGGDQVVSSPDKGRGASLTIRYQLPRP